MTGAALYCAHCGTELTDAGTAARRFGEPFCSEAHADAFASQVRAAKVKAATPAVESAGTAAHALQVEVSGQKSVTGGWTLGRLGKWAVCCGVPLLALAFLAGGGGLLLGVGAAALPYLALLACPLAMYFMMRAMQHGESPKDSKPSTSGSDDRMDQ